MMIVALTMFSLSAVAQNKTVTGRVTDSKDGSVLSNATVTVKGTQLATKTASDGTFSIAVPSGAKQLVISYSGFIIQTVEISPNIRVSLVGSVTTEAEVVVVAYGTRRKTDLTGSVTQVSAKDFQKGNIASPEQLLQGKVAGLQITSGGGQAGGGSKLTIRGASSLNASTDPLIVIDGVPIIDNTALGNSAQNLLNTIDPNDIESMSVLKDASAAALYGSRASGGVIIITTKKGTKGKVKFNYSTQFSVGEVAKEEQVLTGDQVRNIITADAAANPSDTIWKNLLGPANVFGQGYNTDWQKQIYQDAIGYENNISASGSLGIIPFRASLGYLTQEGILKTDLFNRLSPTINLSPKFFDDHLAVNVNFKYAYNTSRYADANAIGAAVSFDPTQPVYAKNNYGNNFEWLTTAGLPINTNGGSVQPDPLSMLEFRNHTGIVNRVLGNVQLDYKLHFFPDLHVLVNVGMDNASDNEQDNQDVNLVTTVQTNNGNISYSGSKYHYHQAIKNSLADVSLFYSKDLKSIHGKIDVLVLHSYQDFETDVYNNPTTATSFTTKLDTTVSSPITYPTDKPEYRIESYLGRVNFTLEDNYLLTASLRRDASSRFAPDKRVGYFPAVAAAWKLKDQFFKNSTLLSELKLRVGVGQTGQQDVQGPNPYYYYLLSYSGSVNAAAEYQFADSFYSFLRPNGAYNPDLTWETTTTYNLGFDFGFLKNRITGNIDVYDKKTTNLLADVAVAPGSNFDIQEYKNIGSMESKGVEFAVNTIPVKNKNITWEFGFNVSYNESKITDLGGVGEFLVGNIQGGTGGTIGVYKVGYDPSSFLVYKQIYNPTTGAPIEGLYVDANRDGQINGSDLYIFKKANPDFLLGINTDITYKKFSLGLAAHGSLGNYLYNNFNSNHDNLKGNGGMENPLSYIQNLSANYLSTKFNNNQGLSDYYIENASYLRLDNINFGYYVGKIFHNGAELRVSASVQNVFVITKYSGLDPENSDPHGIDNNIYPRPRVYSVGLNLNF